MSPSSMNCRRKKEKRKISYLRRKRAKSQIKITPCFTHLEEMTQPI